MNPINIDIPLLRRELADTARESRALKRILRTRWVRPMAAEQKTLAALAARMTALCILRAHLRGRFHRDRPPRGLDPARWDRTAYHQQMAARAADRYALWRETAPQPAGAPR